MTVIIHGIDIPKKHRMNGYYISDDGKVFDVSRKTVVGEATQIPSAESEPHWIWRLADNGWADWICSECGWVENRDIHVTLNYKYCPMCGIYMEPKRKKKKMGGE